MKTDSGRDLVLYRTTLHEVQGLTIAHVTLWLDIAGVTAAGYVALSRIEYDNNWAYVDEHTSMHFVPAADV